MPPSASNSKYTAEYKKKIWIEFNTKQALIGIILGDGFLERVKASHNTRLRIEQSYPPPEKEEYLKSLYTLLEPLTTMTPTILTRKPDSVQVRYINLYILYLKNALLKFFMICFIIK